MSGFLGVFVNLPHIQSEGIGPVLDNLQRCGATALCITPKYGIPSPTGVRFPPLHVDGLQRAFARPVWGEVDLKVAFHLTYKPNQSLYAGTPYNPPAAPSDTHPDQDLPDQLIQEAHRRGMAVHMLFQPLLVPGLKAEDAPMRADGSRMHGNVVSPIGCPNRPDVRAYALASITDLVQRYSEIDGLFLDWTEYGAYRVEDFFTCVCPSCEAAARDMGYDWETMRQDNAHFWSALHQLAEPDSLLHQPGDFLALAEHFPGWKQLQAFKAATVSGLYAEAKRLLQQQDSRISLSARGWCPPWNHISGMAYAQLAQSCDALTPKLFLFDYAAIPRWYGETLLNWNPTLDETDAVEAVLRWFDLPDQRPTRRLEQYVIPPPQEPHPFDLQAYARRIERVAVDAGGLAPLYPFAHAYLPLDQWREMIALVAGSSADGMWIQSYGYLSDEALDVLAGTWDTTPIV